MEQRADMSTETRKIPRSLVMALTIVLTGVTLGCVAMFAAAEWPDSFVLMPLGGFLMAGGCIVAGIIVIFDRGLSTTFRAFGGVQLVGGLVAFAATVQWIGAMWHRF
jgi:hypothetical protein